MIIVDFSQIMVANYMVAVKLYKDNGNDYDLPVIRYMGLNTLGDLNNKFRKEYGNMVIAVDSGNSWRKQAFPYYKARRNKARQESNIDWGALYSMIAQVVKELEEFMPYPVIQVDGAEADDIIGTLARYSVKQQEMSLIVSGDTDFVQCQIDNIWIKQWDKIRSKWISDADPKKYLFEHVVRGDTGDGICNILSPADSLVTGTRQKKIMQKSIDQWWMGNGIKEVMALPRFRENIQMVDLRKTPIEIQQQTMQQYLEQTSQKNRSKMKNYFIANQLKKLYANIGDF